MTEAGAALAVEVSAVYWFQSFKQREKCMKHDLITKAQGYAGAAHGAVGQVRKYTGSPYITHPAAVAHLVGQVTDDPRVIAAAWLHDTLEDTRVSYDDLVWDFGLYVADLVRQVTDVSVLSDGNRKARKALDRAHLAKASPQAMTIKLADIIDNTHDIADCDPVFSGVYMREKRDQLAVLGAGSDKLLAKARLIVDGYFAG